MAVLLGALIALRGSPLAADEEFMNELLEERAPWFDVPALFLDWIGGHLVGVVIVALARTYLGVHWVTDTIGGALLGAGVAVMLWAPIADRLAAEPRARSPRGG